MKTTDIAGILKTVDAVRQEIHPDLDVAFLEAVVLAETQALDDDDDGAMDLIQSALNALLEQKGAF